MVVRALTTASLASPRQLPTPSFTTRNEALLKPAGTTILFRVDVLVVTPADPSDPEVVMQYRIEGYEGPLGPGVPMEWQEARPDGGQWSFTLPVGTMQVRVRSAPKAGSLALPSEPSPPLTFRVKGRF